MYLKIICVNLIVLGLLGCSSINVTPIKSVATFDKLSVYFDKGVEKPARITLYAPANDNGRSYVLKGFTESGLYQIDYMFPNDNNDKMHYRYCHELVVIIPTGVLKYDRKVLHECMGNKVAYEYVTLLDERDLYTDEIALLKKTLSGNRHSLLKKLKSNPAFSSNSCSLPPVGYIPPKPKTLCDYPEKLEKARLSCFVPLGRMACKAIVDYVMKSEGKKATRLEKFVIGQGCSVALKEAIGISSFVDAGADAALDSDSRVMSFLGGGIKAVQVLNAFSCADALEPRCEQKIASWREKVSTIKNKPYETKRQCDYLLSKYNKDKMKYSTIQTKIKKLEIKKNKLESDINRIKKETITKVF